MKQIASKKTLGMYTIAVDVEGTLQIQSPTLLKPLIIESQQAQELTRWLAEQLNIAIPQSNAGTDPVATAVAPTAPVTPTAAPQTVAPDEDPVAVAKSTIYDIIADTGAQYPDSLAPENRDRFIEQVLRNATIRPLVSQGKISRKQVTLWIEQRMGGDVNRW